MIILWNILAEHITGLPVAEEESNANREFKLQAPPRLVASPQAFNVAAMLYWVDWWNAR